MTTGNPQNSLHLLKSAILCSPCICFIFPEKWASYVNYLFCGGGGVIGWGDAPSPLFYKSSLCEASNWVDSMCKTLLCLPELKLKIIQCKIPGLWNRGSVLYQAKIFTSILLLSQGWDNRHSKALGGINLLSCDSIGVFIFYLVFPLVNKVLPELKVEVWFDFFLKALEPKWSQLFFFFFFLHWKWPARWQNK